MWKRDNTTVLTPNEFVNAAEKGRLRAAAAITMNPDARYRVESVYGKAFCMERWPEAYGKPQSGGFMRAFKDAVKSAKSLITTCLVALVLLGSVAGGYAQEVQKPRIYSGTGLYVKNTAGYVYNGGHQVTITASSGSGTALANTQTDCSAPGYAACNFLIAGSTGTKSVTQTLATAAVPGNTLLAFIETASGAITRIVPANISDTIALQALGQTSTFSTAPLPAAAGTIDIGSTTLPFATLWLSGGSGTPAANQFNITGTTAGGVRTITLPDATTTLLGTNNAAAISGPKTFTQSVTQTTATTYSLGSATVPWQYLYIYGTSATPGTNNFQIAGASTSGTRVITLPDASITVPGTIGQACGVQNACDHTLVSSTLKIVSGITAALDGASPSVAAVTGMSPAFTSTTTYACTANLEGTSAAVAALGVAVSQVSSSAVTFTSANAATAKVHYICVGY